MRLAGLLLFTYLAGSINFAIIVLRLLGKEDPRTKFSGNAGTTNVYRQAGWGWAAVVLAARRRTGRRPGVAGPGVPPLRFGPLDRPGPGGGEPLPLFHGFRGGKGVASYLGFAVPIAPWGAVAACLAWVAVHRIVRVPFIASFCMILVLGWADGHRGRPEAISIAGTAATVLLIVFNHKRNIVTLLDERRRQRGE